MDQIKHYDPDVEIGCQCGEKHIHRFATAHYIRNADCPSCGEQGCLSFTDGDDREGITAEERIQLMMAHGEHYDYDAFYTALCDLVKADVETPYKVGLYIGQAFIKKDVHALLRAICGEGLDSVMNRMDCEASEKAMEM